MDTKLKDYIKEIEKASKHPSAELIEYHKTMTAQFQHERFIHLIVTVFFALFFMLNFFAFIFIMLNITSGGWGDVIVISQGLVTLIFLIVTLFYIRHYYQLENGTQKLEEITKKLYKH